MGPVRHKEHEPRVRISAMTVRFHATISDIVDGVSIFALRVDAMISLQFCDKFTFVQEHLKHFNLI